MVADSKRKIKIACSVDNTYSLPLLVMLNSLVATLHKSYRAVIFLLQTNPCRLTLDEIGSFAEVHSLSLAGPHVDSLPPDSRLPPEASAPLFLHELLPSDTDRVIFLDADMLVVDDISPLWTQELAGRAFAAVPDPAIPRLRSPRGVILPDGHSSPDDAAYFNAGVMLIDLAAWREKRIMDNSLAYLSEHGDKAEFLHQEALNAVAWDDWVPLEERWNLPMTAGRWFAQTPAAALSDPAIIHYSGRIKPWCTTHGGRFFDAYSGALEYVRERHAVSLFETFDRSQMLGLYDRSLRSVIYPLEKFLWNRGQI